MIILSVCFLSFLAGNNGYGQNETSWKNYTNNYFNMTLEIPSNWSATDETSRFYEDKSLYFDYEIFDDDKISYSAFARTGIDPLDVSDIRTSIEDEKEYAMSRNNVDSSSFRIIEEIQENKYNISSGPSYSFLYLTNSENLDYAVEIVIFVHNGQGYRLLTMVGPANYFDVPRYSEDLRRVINSIKLSPNNSPPDTNSYVLNNVIANLTTPLLPSVKYLGNENATLDIIEFGDYQDPFSARYNQETKHTIIDKYVNTGIARFGFKDLIINDSPSSKSSTLAAEASYCAGEQNKYWDYHDEIYRNSKGEAKGWISKDSLLGYAKNVGISNTTQFSQCLDSHKYNQAVAKNDIFARNLDLASTPTFVFLNKGIISGVLEGAHPITVFDDVITDLRNNKTK